MSKLAIINYLNECTNNTGDISKLLKILMEVTEYKAGAVFSYDLNLLEKINILNIKIKEKFYDVYVNNFHNFETESEIKNCVSFSLITQNSFIGAVALFNREKDWDPTLLKKVTPILSLFQLCLYNKKIPDIECKDIFLANMSHEIRTPLNGVIGYNQLLSRTHLDSTQKNYLENMNKCSLQLMQIINDILDFSKLSSGRMTVKKESFRPKEILDVSVATLEQRFKSKKQKYYCKIAENVPELIITDKSKCIQMLINLLSNAHKYTPIGGKIEINFFCEENIFSMQVKDNGIGISEKDYMRIFEPFERISCKDQVCSGTGLGLAVSKKLACLLGGNVNVLSTPNVGSIFTISIDYDNHVEDYSLSRNNLQLLEEQVILIVDDNADNRIFISELIFTWKMRPIVCASALEALRLVLGNRYNFNLAIIDICMPGTTGPELAKQIKEERPLLPLIALSSLDYYVNTKDFEHVLSKPVNKSELFNAISSSLVANPTVFLGKKGVPEPTIKEIDYGKKILVVEDVQYNRELLTCMLNNLKYENISISENGLDAWEKLVKAKEEGRPYEIILLDLKMPKVNGYEIIERVNKKKWNLPKIIVVTASILEKDRNKCKKLGAKYFLNKPIDMKQLKYVMLYVSRLIN